VMMMALPFGLTRAFAADHAIKYQV
jgi:hypothetical protein